MNEMLEKIEQEVLDEFEKNLKVKTDDSINGLIIQMASISAKVTKEFIKKYEQEKSL